MRLASRFGYANQIRRDRPLTREELMQVVPSVFGEEKHTSRSENYTWIPTITVLESLQREGFQNVGSGDGLMFVTITVSQGCLCQRLTCRWWQNQRRT